MALHHFKNGLTLALFLSSLSGNENWESLIKTFQSDIFETWPKKLLPVLKMRAKRTFDWLMTYV